MSSSVEQITTPEALNATWLIARQEICQALHRAGDTFDESDLIASIMSGEAQLWRCGNSACVTEFVAYPQRTAVRFSWAGGDLSELQAVEAHVTAMAREQGIDRVEICGRSGWGRVLPGFRETARVFVKDLKVRQSNGKDQ